MPLYEKIKAASNYQSLYTLSALFYLYTFYTHTIPYTTRSSFLKVLTVSTAV